MRPIDGPNILNMNASEWRRYAEHLEQRVAYLEKTLQEWNAITQRPIQLWTCGQTHEGVAQ